MLPFLRIYCLHLLHSVKLLFLFLYVDREFKVNKSAKKYKMAIFPKGTVFSFGEGHYTQQVTNIKFCFVLLLQ